MRPLTESLVICLDTVKKCLQEINVVASGVLPPAARISADIPTVHPQPTLQGLEGSTGQALLSLRL